MVLISAYSQLDMLTLVSKIESTESGSSRDGKPAIIQYKPVTSFAGNENMLGYYEQSHGYVQISLPNIHGCMGVAVITLMSYTDTV